ncbi:MAG: polysaccharide biosynthesis C-terminal domain-containing protein [Bacilli bacterium]|nr:polysaccharide biosynthesis C-terminal domain-containing protein [Bacilli bacterium]
MSVHISEHFTFKKISKITAFPIIMMLFISLYSVVDGLFISNFSNNDAFAAVNLIFPLIMIIGSIGFMLGAGGTALVSKYLGEQNKEKANKTFSLIVYATITFGVFFSIFGALLIKPIVYLLASLSKESAQGMIDYAIMYGQVMMLGQIAFMLQNVFQSFFLVAEKGRTGFFFVLAAGITNIILDALFVAVLKMGILGAALGTIIGYIIGGFGPLLYFILKKDLPINLGKAELSLKDLFKSLYNGMSEFVSNISMSLVTIIYNAQLLKAFGVNGVSAYGVVCYVSFLFVAIFIGYSIGMAPTVGYNYGAQNKKELHNMLKKSLIIIGSISILMCAFSLVASHTIAVLFSRGEEELIALATTAMIIYSFAYLAMGFSIYSSSFFTALNNGAVSAIISLCRTLIFQIALAFLFPLIFGDKSLWWAIVTGEILSVILSSIFLLTMRKKYGY